MYEYEIDVSNLVLILPHDEQSCDNSLYLLREQLGLLKKRNWSEFQKSCKFSFAIRRFRKVNSS